MRSDNLKRHYKTCKFNENSCLTTPTLDAGVNSIHVGDGSRQQSKDPRISNLINRLVDSTEADENNNDMKIRKMMIGPSSERSTEKRKFPDAEWNKLGGEVEKNEEREIEEDNEEVEDEETGNEERDIQEEVFHDVISKDKNELEKMINDLLQESEFSEKVDEIKDLFHLYLTDGKLKKYLHDRNLYPKYVKGYEVIVDKMFNKLKGLERRGKKGPALRMQVLLQAMENVRRVIDELFRIMNTEREEQKKSALVRLKGPNGITWEEYLIFDRLLNPEIVKSVLKERVTKLY